MTWKVRSSVKELRKQSGLTQEELAGRIGVSRQTIISIEKGRYIPSLTLALRMSRFFDCPTEEIFKLREE